ncbi:hypothetical protein B0H14DRAFT_2676747 [Mycena olivaceomarginata]|nr:hypothetical protein B0H14DRAFT_2676747 [Mycena olivaceomarginata]
MSKVEEPTQSQRPNSRYERVPSLFFICFAFHIATSLILRKAKLKPKSFQEKLTCVHRIPTLFASHTPRPDAPRLQEAAASLHEFLSIRTAASDIDSLSIAVVNPRLVPISNHGLWRSQSQRNLPRETWFSDTDSIYRIASITKMFTVLETLILRERGALSWSGRSCHQIFPNFTHPSSGWSDFLRETLSRPIYRSPCVRLASHLSGLGRDYPPEDVGEPWPRPLPAGAKEDEPPDEFLRAVAKYPLVAPQYSFPRRLAAQIAVPSSNSELAYSSLADLETVMQSLLSPQGTVRDDGFYEVGAPWEITKVGNGARLYSKVLCGNLPGTTAKFSINVQWSYGVIVLVSGNYKTPLTLALEATFSLPTCFRKPLGAAGIKNVTAAYHALYLQALVVRDQDRRPSGESTGIALWSTGRPHEFRLAIGRPELNDNPDAGTNPMARGAPLELALVG